MKKALIASIIGLAAVVSTYGQGVIQFASYNISPYNQVYWNNSAGGVGVANAAVQDANVQIQVWYALGTVTDANLLTLGATTGISFDAAAVAYTPAGGTHGPGGFFNIVNVPLAGWSSGPVTFQLRATGTENGNTFTGSSALWQESAQIQPAANAALMGEFTPALGVTVVPVPEPSTFALAGLGSLAMMMFRRKK